MFYVFTKFLDCSHGRTTRRHKYSKRYLTLSPFGNCACFLSSSHFFQNQLFTIKVSNSLDPDQALDLVGPDLGPICLQRLTADVTS